MEIVIIDFKAGPQVAGTIVRDMYGQLWRVLKNIGYASAQPKEGSYYTRYTPPPVDYSDLINKLTLRVGELETKVGELEKRPEMASDVFYFNDKDFYYEEDLDGKKTIRKR